MSNLPGRDKMSKASDLLKTLEGVEVYDNKSKDDTGDKCPECNMPASKCTCNECMSGKKKQSESTDGTCPECGKKSDECSCNECMSGKKTKASEALAVHEELSLEELADDVELMDTCVAESDREDFDKVLNEFCDKYDPTGELTIKDAVMKAPLEEVVALTDSLNKFKYPEAPAESAT